MKVVLTRPTGVCAVAFLAAALASSDVDAVLEPAALLAMTSVEDARGNPVVGLGRDDFLVIADDLPQSVAEVKPGGALTLALLLDISVSQWHCPLGMAGLPSSTAGVGTGGFGLPLPSQKTLNEARLIQPALPPFQIRGLRPDDRVRVGAIGRRLFLDERFSTDAAERSRTWGSFFDLPPVEWLGPSPIWDAIGTLIPTFEGEPDPHVVVLISDGEATGNARGAQEIALAAAVAGVQVSFVAEEALLPSLPRRTMASEGIDPTKNMSMIADATGGTVVLDKAAGFPRDECFDRDPGSHLRQLLNRLHRFYLVSFVPARRDGQVHKLDIRVKRPGLTSRARKAYR